MIRAICIAIVFATAGTQGAATPCVSPTFDVPFPDATDVTSRVIDLPSSAFPAFWQEGLLDGYAYQVFANATGRLRGGARDQPWVIEVTCDVSSETCEFTQKGNPPKQATAVAERIGKCLVPTLAIDDALPVPPEKAPQPSDSGLELSLDRSVEEEPMPCGLAMTDELTDVATLQRLLVLLGEDPGPVDGFLGARSFAAMEAYVSNPGWETPISDLISELSERHCAGLR